MFHKFLFRRHLIFVTLGFHPEYRYVWFFREKRLQENMALY